MGRQMEEISPKEELQTRRKNIPRPGRTLLGVETSRTSGRQNSKRTSERCLKQWLRPPSFDTAASKYDRCDAVSEPLVYCREYRAQRYFFAAPWIRIISSFESGLPSAPVVGTGLVAVSVGAGTDSALTDSASMMGAGAAISGDNVAGAFAACCLRIISSGEGFAAGATVPGSADALAAC